MAIRSQVSDKTAAAIARAVALLATGAALIGVAVGGFIVVRLEGLPIWALFFVALVWSLGSSVLLYMFAQRLADVLPPKVSRVVTPFFFIAPVVILLSWGLLIPLVRTFVESFLQNSSFTGFNNYVKIFTNADGWLVLRNNALWIIVGTPVALTIGMIVAVLADRRRFERLIKTIIFLPLSISLVGAGVIWSLVYRFSSEEGTQLGLLNAVVVGLGGEPQGWVQTFIPWNNLFLMVISIWSGTGFSMVFFAAALRGVPQELTEAARVDGASEARIFFGVQLPYIWPTILAVASTSIIFNLKIFDVIQTLTGGGFETEVVATAFYRAQYESLDPGLAAAFAILLLLLVVPVMYYNFRQFRAHQGIHPGGQSLLRRTWNKTIIISKNIKQVRQVKVR